MNSTNASLYGSQNPSDDRSQRRIESDGNNYGSGIPNNVKHHRGYQINNTHHSRSNSGKRFRRG